MKYIALYIMVLICGCGERDINSNDIENRINANCSEIIIDGIKYSSNTRYTPSDGLVRTVIIGLKKDKIGDAIKMFYRKAEYVVRDSRHPMKFEYNGLSPMIKYDGKMVKAEIQAYLR